MRNLIRIFHISTRPAKTWQFYQYTGLKIPGEVASIRLYTAGNLSVYYSLLLETLHILSVFDKVLP